MKEEADPEPLPPGEYLLRVHPGENLHEVLVLEEFPAEEGAVTRVFRREVREGLPQGALADQTAKGADWHYKQVRHIVRRAKELYVSRRGWHQDFLDKFEAYSRSYINDTVYQEVREGRELRSAMRFIQAPFALVDGVRSPTGPVVEKIYGRSFDRFREPGDVQPDSELPRPPARLPEAEYLHLDLPLWAWPPKGSTVPCGIEIEVGTYFVEKGPPHLHDIWKAELGVQLLRFAHRDLFDDGFNYNGVAVHTYADVRSLSLYEPLGFTKLRQYTLRGVKVEIPEGEEPPRIEAADGSKWWPLVHYVATLDEANEMAATQSSPWLFSEGAYRKSLARPSVPGRTSKIAGPDALPAWESFLHSLESDDYEVVIPAIDTLIRFADLQRVHYETLQESSLDPRRAEMALRAYRSLDPVMARVEKALIRLTRSPNPSTRMYVIDMVPALVRGAHRRNFLKKEMLLKEIVCATLSDPDQINAMNAAYWLQGDFNYAEILESLGGYWPEFDGPEVHSRIQERALASLRAEGVDDSKINYLVDLIHGAMTESTHLECSGIRYQKCFRIQAMGCQLSAVSKGNADIVRNLLILTAGRHSAPVVLQPLLFE